MVNIFEAKARLSEFVDRAGGGERIVICRRNQPVAELVPIRPSRLNPRAIGGAKSQFQVPYAFFEPLPDDLLDDYWRDTSSRLNAALPTLPAARESRDAVTSRKPKKAQGRARRRRS
jgi:prevent-host-death family protein